MDELTTSSLMLIAVATALFMGIKIRKKIKSSAYKKVLRGLLMILATSLLLKVING